MTPNVFLSYCPRFVVGHSLKFILLNSCSHNIMIFLRSEKREKKELASKKRKKMRFRNQPIAVELSAILKNTLNITILSQSGAVRRLCITSSRPASVGLEAAKQAGCVSLLSLQETFWKRKERQSL